MAGGPTGHMLRVGLGLKVGIVCSWGWQVVDCGHGGLLSDVEWNCYASGSCVCPLQPAIF